ncbi:MAG TPA: DNA repair protein RecN [Paludibacteraceae bacterium]|nr:DNA repair protein RecN [Paludibacteraceae bacterium]HPH62822.1 DNA repair protein RecN [Paludibacteraceae bacterium]HQF50195.1 DNA repair protein RecN [Paludibacteraceae bacterium]
MLKRLSVENYALIDKSIIEVHPGFSVITGETGAGKSILLGALGLILGQRADSKALKNQEMKCVVEALFDISNYGLNLFFEEENLDYDDECIIRREILPNGKSRSFINDTPANVSTLKLLGEKLIDIHSQHENLLLNDNHFQLKIVDAIADNEKRLSTYREIYFKYETDKRTLARLREEIARQNANRDYLEFQLKQLQDAALQGEEQEALESEAERLTHSSEIKGSLSKALWLLDENEQSVNQALKDASASLKMAGQYLPEAASLADRLDSCLIETKDIVRELEVKFNDVEVDPNRLDAVNERLDLIYTLEKKHNVDSVAKLLELQNSFDEQLQLLDSGSENVERLKKEIAEQLKTLLSMAGELSAARKEHAPKIEDQILDLLHRLGMPNAKLKIDFKELQEPGTNGMDEVNFLFSANKDKTLQPIASIASGGEISRVMLSLKSVLSQSSDLPTIILDEIDTGVSGEIADKMGDLMQQMGHNMQVISITHLPQIAAKGATHYKVYKMDDEKSTTSNIKQLTDEERIHEIAQMLSGSSLSEAAVNNAKELLKVRK